MKAAEANPAPARDALVLRPFFFLLLLRLPVPSQAVIIKPLFQ
jgi:hypothetical protein